MLPSSSLCPLSIECHNSTIVWISLKYSNDVTLFIKCIIFIVIKQEPNE